MEELENSIAELNFKEDYNYNKDYTKLAIKDDTQIKKTIRQYNGILILFQEKIIRTELSSTGSEIKTTHLRFQDYAFDMTDIFKNAVDKIPDKDCYKVLSTLFNKFIYQPEEDYQTVFNIYLINPK